MPFKSAYLKLTLFYILIAMLISAAFSVVLYQISSNELDTALHRQGRILQNLPPAEFRPNRLPEFERTRLAQLEESSSRLKFNLISFNILIFVLSGGASYFLARRTLKPIEEMMNIQNRFTADASHELRTPLTAMKTEIEVSLRDKKFDLRNAKDLLQSNLEEIEKLEALSNGLLTLAQYQESQNIKPERISLSEILEAAYKKVESSAKNKKINIEIKSVSVQISGNKKSLTELFVILLDNAVKYSNENGEVMVSSSVEGKHVIINIKDNGIGIKSSDLPHIFDRFYRADLSRSKEKIAGYGLGLAIAKKIVETHSGKIEVSSIPGKETTFTVRLPLV